MCEQHNEIKDDYDVSFSTQLDFSIITFAREVSVCFHQCLFFFLLVSCFVSRITPKVLKRFP